MAEKAQAVRPDSKKLQALTQQKFELAAKMREIRADIGRINVDLARLGADSAIIACW